MEVRSWVVNPVRNSNQAGVRVIRKLRFITNEKANIRRELRGERSARIVR